MRLSVRSSGVCCTAVADVSINCNCIVSSLFSCCTEDASSNIAEVRALIERRQRKRDAKKAKAKAAAAAVAAAQADAEDEDSERDEQQQRSAKKRKLQQRNNDDKTEEEQQEEEEEQPVKKSKARKGKRKSKKSKKSKKSAAVKKQKRRPNTNKRDPLPRIQYEDLYKPENWKYADGQMPFILQGALGDWHKDRYWSTQYLRQEFAHATVDFYPANMDRSDTHPFLVAMTTALDEQTHPTSSFPSNNVRPGTYIQWNIDRKDWIKLSEHMHLPYQFTRDNEWIESCLPTEELRDLYTKRVHWRMLLVGNKGAGMFNHQDVLRTASWQAQLWGSKRWHICAPTESRYLYSAGQIDAFDPDYERYPLFHHARCYEDIVESGDMLFYPKDYWHQTENLATPSICVSASVLDEHNYREIAHELKAECKTQKYKWQFTAPLCEALEVCYNWWENR